MSTLHGIRVLEIGSDRVSALVGMLLADYGADVVRVEPEHVAPAERIAGAAVFDRGKRSVRADETWLSQAILGTDILVLGTQERLPPQALEAARANGRLIEARLPCWLPGNTPWTGGHESHGLLSAYGGVAWRQSSTDGSPVELVAPYLHHIQAAWAAACIGAALVERGDDGFGQRVIVSGINGIMNAMAFPFAIDPNAPDVATDLGSLGRHATYRPFRCGDGRWISCGALGHAFEVRFLSVLGVGHILDDPRIGGNPMAMRRPRNLGWCTATIEEAFARADSGHWLGAMREAGLPVEPVARREELMDHEQVVAAGLRIDLDDPRRGRVTMPGASIKLAGSPAGIVRPAPLPGDDTGIAPWPALPQPTRPRSYAPGPLHGIRVLNTGTFVATPYAGSLLAMLGAEVVKVERTDGDPFRLSGYPVNRGMKSLAIDLTEPDGRAAFYRLVAVSDAVVDGMRPGVMKRLGLDHEALERHNPGIVTMSLSAYGETGPCRDLPGVDMAIQGLAGMMDAQGEDDQPVCPSIALVDVCTASLSAFAVTLGLIHRRRAGKGQHIANSLLGTACYLQVDALARYGGRPPLPRGSVDYRGSDWADRFYRTADGWVRIDATRVRNAALPALANGGLLPAGTDEAGAARALTENLSKLCDAAAVAMLNGCGVPAVPARRISGVLADPDLVDAEVFHFSPSEAGGTLCLAGRHASFGRTPLYGRHGPPGAGEHSREVLAQAGVTERDIDDLIRRGLVACGPPMPARLAEIYR